MSNVPDPIRSGGAPIGHGLPNSPGLDPVDQDESLEMLLVIPADDPLDAGPHPVADPPDADPPDAEPRPADSLRTIEEKIKETVRVQIKRYRIKRINSLIETRHTIRRVLDKMELDDVERYGDRDDCKATEELRHDYESISLSLAMQLSNLAIENGGKRFEDIKFFHQGSVYGVEFDPGDAEYRPSCMPRTTAVEMEGNR